MVTKDKQMNEDFVETFISECIDNGITNMGDICNLALEKRNELDKKIEEIQALKIQREKLQDVLRSLNHDESKGRGRRSKQPIVNIIDDENDPTYTNLLCDICDIIDKSHGPMTPREVITQIGYSNDDPSPVYMAIKWLASRGVLSRNSFDRTIERGENWGDRPHQQQAVEG